MKTFQLEFITTSSQPFCFLLFFGVSESSAPSHRRPVIEVQNLHCSNTLDMMLPICLPWIVIAILFKKYFLDQYIIHLNDLPPSTKEPTHEINPDRNELNGKVPTKQQYTNCMIPVSIMYAKYASTIFNFLGVLLTYSS